MKQLWLSIKLAVPMLLAATPFTYADNWPQWRGPENNGHSKEKGLPVKWDEKTNIAWKLPLPGRGGSTPIVWGDRIFLTSMEGTNVALLSISTGGKLIWKKTVSVGSGATPMKGEGDEASPSCSTDGKLVFVYTGTADMACYDFDGNQKWKFNTKQRYGNYSIQHGIHSSPLLDGDRLYFSILGNPKERKHLVVAIDKATGENVWVVDRPSDARSESREAYTSPVIWRNGSEQNLVILGCDYCTGHSLKDGSELWRLSDINLRGVGNHRIISTPTASDDLLIVPTCREQLVFGVKPGVSGAVKTGSPGVQWRIDQGSGDVSAALIHDGVVYLPAGREQLLAIDAKTGTTLYAKSLTKGRYRASPVYADGHVYLVGRDQGNITVLNAGRKLDVLADNQLKDNFTASPAIANGRIYLRGFQALYAISEGGK